MYHSRPMFFYWFSIRVIYPLMWLSRAMTLTRVKKGVRGVWSPLFLYSLTFSCPHITPILIYTHPKPKLLITQWTTNARANVPQSSVMSLKTNQNSEMKFPPLPSLRTSCCWGWNLGLEQSLLTFSLIPPLASSLGALLFLKAGFITFHLSSQHCVPLLVHWGLLIPPPAP